MINLPTPNRVPRPRPLDVGDCGHLQGDDTPLVIIAVCGEGRIKAIDDDGAILMLDEPCFVAETASLCPKCLRQAQRRSRLLAWQ